MKKRIAFALCMILMVLMLGACGTDPTTVDYNGKSYSDLQSDMDTNAGMVQSHRLKQLESGRILWMSLVK